MVEEDPDEVEVVVGADEVELLNEELEDEAGHVSTLTMLLSRVTLAPSAKTPPLDTAAVSSVTEAAAIMFP
jgi:hypothetical protein